MADAESLTHAFMRAHPAEAAQVLEAVPPGDAAALFSRAPARDGAAVLGAMLPAAGARALAGLDDERAMELLGALGTQPAVALLRHVAEPRRSHLVGGLPTAAALASRLLLGYPEDTVGAWADPHVVALSPGTRAREALERVRGDDGRLERVFVVDSAQKVVGWVTLAALLRAPDGATLDSLMSPPEAVLAARTPLAAAATHPAWRRASLLPVLEPGGRLLGALPRESLERALGRLGKPVRRGGDDTMLGVLARGYWEGLSGMAEAAATLLPPAPRLKPNDDEL